MALSDQNIFCYFARIVVGFFCPSSPIFNRHFLFFFPFVFIGKGDSVFICFFVICNIQHIHIYSNPSPNKTKIYLKKKNYIIVWVRVVSVGAYTSHWNHCSIFFLFFYFFFFAFCTIYNRFSSSCWRLLDSFFPFSRHYALHSNRLYLICISNNNKTQERKSL